MKESARRAESDPPSYDPPHRDRLDQSQSRLLRSVASSPSLSLLIKIILVCVVLSLHKRVCFPGNKRAMAAAAADGLSRFDVLQFDSFCRSFLRICVSEGLKKINGKSVFIRAFHE